MRRLSTSLPGSPTFRLRLHTGPLKAEQRSVTRQLKRAKLNDCSDAQVRVVKALQRKGLKRLATRVWAASCQRRPR